MAKKYFVVSDVHSFYRSLRASLAKADFKLDNEDHVLIVLGDIFDRGDEPLEVYEFLKSIPDDRLILVRGNHERLYLDLLDKSYPEYHDFANGTVETFCHIAKEDTKYLETVEYGDLDSLKITESPKAFWGRVRSKVRKSEVTKWLKSSRWKNYYELDKFVFVHSFIPAELKPEFRNGVFLQIPRSMLRSEYFQHREDWREATDFEWGEATWGCPYRLFAAGCFDRAKENGKTLVCGHWRTSDFYKFFEDNYVATTAIYFSDGLIGIDGGVSLMADGERLHHQNVLVIDENMDCFDENGVRLPYSNEKEQTI